MIQMLVIQNSNDKEQYEDNELEYKDTIKLSKI